MEKIAFDDLIKLSVRQLEDLENDLWFYRKSVKAVLDFKKASLRSDHNDMEKD